MKEEASPQALVPVAVACAKCRSFFWAMKVVGRVQKLASGPPRVQGAMQPVSESASEGGSEPWRGAIRSETRAVLQEMLQDIGLPVGASTQPPSPSRQPEYRRTPSAPASHLRLPLGPPPLSRTNSTSPWAGARSMFTRGISEGGAEVVLNDAAIASTMHEWHRHPRKHRSRSASPANKKFRKFTGQGSGSRFLRAPTMPAEEQLIRTSRRYGQMTNPLLIKELSTPAESRLAALVESTEFSGFIGAMILANALSIGLQTQHEADTWSLSIPPGFAISCSARSVRN